MTNWVDSLQDHTVELKNALWDNEEFVSWVAKRGDDDALRSLFEFKWSLTDQIRMRKDAEEWVQGGDWENRISRLVIRVNQRRTQLKNHIRSLRGDDYLYELIGDIREENEDL